MKNIISIENISLENMEHLFNVANKRDELFNTYKGVLNGKILGTLFFQPSTRTQLSFQSSFVKLGGSVIGFSDIQSSRSGSSSSESFEDLGKIIESYCDVITMRSSFDNDIKSLSSNCDIPIISAGNGQEEHPTQALIDIFTMQSYIKDLNEVNLLICGNLHYRTINSLLLGLRHWPDINIHILTPEVFNLDARYIKKIEKLKNLNIYHDYEELRKKNILNKIDFLYQEEFHNGFINSQDAYKQFKKFYLTQEIFDMFNKDIKILHPLPRTKTLPTWLDEKENSIYFEQARNGLYIRAALFLKLFEHI